MEKADNSYTVILSDKAASKRTLSYIKLSLVRCMLTLLLIVDKIMGGSCDLLGSVTNQSGRALFL